MSAIVAFCFIQDTTWLYWRDLRVAFVGGGLDNCFDSQEGVARCFFISKYCECISETPQIGGNLNTAIRVTEHVGVMQGISVRPGTSALES